MHVDLVALAIVSPFVLCLVLVFVDAAVAGWADSVEFEYSDKLGNGDRF